MSKGLITALTGISACLIGHNAQEWGTGIFLSIVVGFLVCFIDEAGQP